jgi:hypothetical protein
LLIFISAKAIDINQLDIKKLNFYQRKYKPMLKLDTIALPSFSGKYITFEGVTLSDPAQLEFLDVKAYANSNELFSFRSEKEIKGPFKDPVFTLSISIKDRDKAMYYLDIPRFILDKNLSAAGTNYKVIQNIITENSFNIVNLAEGVNDIFIPLPTVGLEDMFYITINGHKYERSLNSETLDAYKYKVNYTGDGYNIVFASLPLNSTVTCYIKTLPNVISRNYLYIPSK